MTASDPYPDHTPNDSQGSSLVRAAIWVAIGALIAAAIVCVIWVLVGTQNGIIGRAFLTILLLAAFAGVAIIDAQLAPRRPSWFALASMVTWVVTLLIGAVMIWMPERYSWSGFTRFVQFLLIVLILQLALLHIRLYTKAFFRHVTTFTQIVTIVTICLVIGLAVMLVLPLMLGEWVDFADLYWRFVVAITILAAVGTALVPLINALFAPKKPRPAARQSAQPIPGAALPPWPTYADGVTPLPMMPDGSPDWNAYYTGYPSNISQAIAPVAPFAPPSGAQPSVPRGYEGFPPPPPLPPRP
jgi:MFS family permease